MIYRVVFQVGYSNTWFDFDTIESAGDFAKMILVHQVGNEDTPKRNNVSVKVIDPSIKDEEEE